MRRSMQGWGSGLVGVLIFSGSLPATRVAVAGFTPLFLTPARAVIAGLLGALLLLALRQRAPTRRDLPSLVVVAIGVVVGFPLLTALALQHMTAARSVVFVGLLPVCTAIFASRSAPQRPKPVFWFFSLTGAALVAGFALWRGAEGSRIGDAFMLAAILLCGLGYAEGAALSRRLGGWQVISWALVAAFPLMAAIAFATAPAAWRAVGEEAWLGLAYVSVFSMLIGFVFWYRGLARGGIAAVGQLQLLQPFFGLGLSGILLGEPVAWSMIAVTGLVVLCVAGARRFA